MQTTLYQLELDHAIADCGMSYVFHLRDGRFFIIDGGSFMQGEEDRLYHFLKERCDSIPVIAAYFFSHAHQDHIGNFINFALKCREQVVIEKLIYHFPPIDFSSAGSDWKSSEEATVKKFYSIVEQYYSDVITIAHTGDVFQIGEITVEILYTHEDLYPVQSTFNDSTTVITTQTDGQKILWLGDIYKEGSRILMQNKKDKLACDIVQVAHHGFFGATRALYAETKAKVALWPTPHYVMERIRSNHPQIRDNDVNLFVLNDMNIREHWISGNGTVELPLPYQYGTAILYPKKFFGRPDMYT